MNGFSRGSRGRSGWRSRPRRSPSRDALGAFSARVSGSLRAPARRAGIRRRSASRLRSRGSDRKASSGRTPGFGTRPRPGVPSEESGAELLVEQQAVAPAALDRGWTVEGETAVALAQVLRAAVECCRFALFTRRKALGGGSQEIFSPSGTPGFVCFVFVPGIDFRGGGRGLRGAAALGDVRAEVLLHARLVEAQRHQRGPAAGDQRAGLRREVAVQGL